MLTYEKAQEMLAKRSIRKLARNTYLRQEGDNVVIKLHNTDVITISPNDIYTLNSGGWRTPTTKERFNTFSPANVSQEKSAWYITEGKWPTPWDERKVVPYADGIQVNRQGIVVAGAGKDTSKAMAKLNKLISTYIKGFQAHVIAKGLEEPSGGDCWACYFKADDRLEPLGYAHYFEHFKEGYYVPSLLAKAIMEAGYRNPGFIWSIIKISSEKGEESHSLKNSLRAYFRKRKQGLLEEMLR
jgi:hypothetical protein